MAFHVGQKVVCVEEFSNEYAYGDEVMPKVGEVYTIHEMLPPTDRMDDATYLILEEIRNVARQYDNGFGEVRFHAGGFRPVVSRKTDISVFTEILNTTPTTPQRETV